jgi:general secretion pathway protein F
MTAFRFHAANADDRPQMGLVEARDLADAARLLIDRGLYPIELTANEWSWTGLLNKRFGSSLSTVDSAQILVDLGHLLGAGVELAVALSTTVATPAKQRVHDVLQHLLRDVRMGRALSDAMSGPAVGFPSHVIAVIRAGEISGTLANALMQAGGNLRQAAVLRSKVRTALIYPVCVSVAIAFAILVLVGVVVPALESIFADGLQRLPWQTRMLVLGGRFAREHVIALAALFFALSVGSYLLCKHPGARMRLEKVALRIPLVGHLLATAETARIATVLALLSSAGLPLVQAVTIARDCARLNVTRDAFLTAGLKLREGARLHEALGTVTVLGPRVLALIRIGEITGQLNVLLSEAARDAEQRVAMAVDRMLALLTPVMTLLFGSIAGFVLYAVMTAILSVNELATITR